MSWLSGWQYRKSHDIKGSTSGSVSNYQVRITVHYGSGTDNGEHVYLNGKCRSDFGDIRFTESDGVTELSYWMEKKVNSNYAIFWVKIPSIPASPNTVTIYIYYGNSSATTTSSGADTFSQYWNCETDPFTTSDVGDGITHETSTERVHSGNYSVKMTAQDHSLMELDWDDLTEDCEVILFVNHHSSSTGSININLGDGGGDWLTHTSVYMNLRTDGAVDAWNGTTQNRFTGKHDLDTFERIQIRLRMSNKKWDLVIDDEVLFTNYKWYTSSISTVKTLETGNPTGTAGNKVTIAYFDDIAVRKWIDPEPSHDVWGSEESSPPEFVPLFTPEDTNSTTDTSVIDDELATYEEPPEVITPLFTPESTNSTTDTSIIDDELVTYEEPPEAIIPLFTPEDTSSTTDTSIIDDELVTYEKPPTIITPLFTPEATNSTTDTSIIDDELVTYEEPTVAVTVVVTNEDVTPDSAFEGDSVTYNAIVKDENGNTLPEDFIADLLLDSIVVVDNQQFVSAVYDSSTGELILTFTVPETSAGTKTVKLKWEEQTI